MNVSSLETERFSNAKTSIEHQHCDIPQRLRNEFEVYPFVSVRQNILAVTFTPDQADATGIGKVSRLLRAQLVEIMFLGRSKNTGRDIAPSH